ncbi:MAG: glycosyl transferase [bacterium]|nr:MAG: glycosyl transferase [bacterium]KAF0149818.1 MAG: glycosyl transferase [bacterium]KAF0168519.1 MAG: glycosyl transferase [bacterium]TXT19547.1 MAG: glycosyl transferase [bacterium]
MKLAVSVIMPTYNGAKYIRQAIESALEQTYPIHELIVVDDGSLDNTVEIVNGYGGPVKLISQNNMRTACAYNTGIDHATGDLIAFLEHDDLWKPNKNAIQVEYLNRHHECGLVFTPVELLKDGIVSKQHSIDDQALPGVFGFADFFLENRILNCSSVMVRADVFRHVGIFRDDMRLAFDYDLWLRIASKYSIACLEEITTLYRIHAANLSSDANEYMAAEGHLQTLAHWQKDREARMQVGTLEFDARLVAAYLRMAWAHACQGERRGEVEKLWAAVKIKPFALRNWRELIWRSIDPTTRNRINWYCRHFRRHQ